MLVNICQTTWRHVADDSTVHSRRCEDLTSHRDEQFKPNTEWNQLRPKSTRCSDCLTSLISSPVTMKLYAAFWLLLSVIWLMWWQVFAGIVTHMSTVYWTNEARTMLHSALITPPLVPRGMQCLVPSHFSGMSCPELKTSEQKWDNSILPDMWQNVINFFLLRYLILTSSVLEDCL
jgi:hypothetical protein